MVSGLPFVIVMTGVGIISLAGVVVNNAIVLLDYTMKAPLMGKNRQMEAIVEAGENTVQTGSSYRYHNNRWACPACYRLVV